MPLYRLHLEPHPDRDRELAHFSKTVRVPHGLPRVFPRKLLLQLPLEENDDDFAFDNQMLVQAAYFGFQIAEVTCPTSYFEEASSISFQRSVTYGFGVLRAAASFRLSRMGVATPQFLNPNGRKLLA